MSHILPRASLSDWGWLVIMVILWGVAFAFIKQAVQTMAPATLVFIRLALAGLILTGWAYSRGRRLPPLRDRRWVWMLALGFTGNTLPFTLISWGQQTIDSALAGILVATMPIATLGLAHIFVPGERLTPRKLIGFAFGFMGVVILLGPSALTDIGGADTLAQLAVVGAACCYAINAILARMMPETPPSVSGAGLLLGGAVFIAPFGIWPLFSSPDIAVSAWGSALFLAIGPTAIATILLMRLAKHPGPSFVAVANYLTPLAAVAAGVAIGETIGWRALLALAIILGGVLIARGTKKAA